MSVLNKFSAAVVVLAGALLFLGSTSVQAEPDCTVTGGVFDAADLNAVGGACWGEPDYYGITVIAMGLCETEPTAPTVGAALDISGCTAVFGSISGGGSLVEVVSGTSSALPGPFTRPPDGSYPYGYMILDRQIRIQLSSEFSETMTAVSKGTASAGLFCWTKDSTNSSVVPGTDMFECGAAAQTAGTVIDTVDDVGGFSATVASGSDSMDVFLLTSTNLLAAAQVNVNKIYGLVTFGSPVTVDRSSSALDISFTVTQGMSVSDDGTQGNLSDIIAGPFQASISVR